MTPEVRWVDEPAAVSRECPERYAREGYSSGWRAEVARR